MVEPCMHCGGHPKVKEDRRTVGHGECSNDLWLECECGIRTVSRSLGYQGTRAEIMLMLEEIWN